MCPHAWPFVCVVWALATSGWGLAAPHTMMKNHCNTNTKLGTKQSKQNNGKILLEAREEIKNAQQRSKIRECIT